MNTKPNFESSIILPQGISRAERKRLRKQTAAERKNLKPKAEVDPALSAMAVGAKWGKMGRMWGPVAPKLPAHEISTARIGVATPVVAPSSLGIEGLVIGLSAPTGEPFMFDPWEAYVRGLVSSPGIAIFGTQGAGKSMCAKVLAWRLMGYGRQVIVQSDPKGEWVAAARAVGGLVVQFGLGSCINPLEEGTCPPSMSGPAWKSAVADRRAIILRSIISVLRDGREFTDNEEIIIDELVEMMSLDQVPATIQGLVQVLGSPPARLVGLAPVEVSLLLGRILRRCTIGSLAGMFDQESTIQLRPDMPMVVFDTSVISEASPQVKAIASACISAWVDATLRSMDGRFRVVISEEGWSQMSNRHLVAGMDERLRMAGHWRVCNVLITHEISDADQFGDPGSAIRAQIKGIFSKSPIKIVYRQSAQEMATLSSMLNLTEEEAEIIPTLGQGFGLWRIGASASVMVHPVTTPLTYELFNTDTGRAGHFTQDNAQGGDNSGLIESGSKVIEGNVHV